MYYGEIRTWAQIVHRSRRFFSPEAAQEIWLELSPALGNIFTPQCLEVQPAPSCMGYDVTHSYSARELPACLMLATN